MADEHPDARRERRLAEARARRGTTEWEAEGAALAAKKAEEARAAERRRKSASTANVRKSPENSSDMFGHPWPVWFQMRDAGVEYLQQCARERRYATYGELWQAIGDALGEDIGNHWRQLPILLGYMSVAAFPDLDLILTALVVSPDQSDGPGPGFFRIAAELGALSETESPPEGENWSMTDAQRAYWDETVHALFDRFALA